MPRGIARGLDKSAIVTAAFAVLEETGLDGLTVRAVASRLDVRAPALYWHVRGKKDLLDEMSTELLGRITAQLDLGSGSTWQQELRTYAQATRTTLLGIRDGARVFGGAYVSDPSLLQGQERIIAGFLTQGFDLPSTVLAWRLVHDFTLGFCIEEQGARQSRSTLAARDARIDAEAHPLTAQAGRHILGDPTPAFEEMLDVLLVAVQNLRNRHRRP